MVTVSAKFQIVIPRAIREALGIKPGDTLHGIEYRGRIQLIPLKSALANRAFLRGIATDVHRHPDRG
jgi:AbrB family looped-hinge helix DNA binding protein